MAEPYRSGLKGFDRPSGARTILGWPLGEYCLTRDTRVFVRFPWRAK
jgi:hypothetical protein